MRDKECLLDLCANENGKTRLQIIYIALRQRTTSHIGNRRVASRAIDIHNIYWCTNELPEFIIDFALGVLSGRITDLELPKDLQQHELPR